jgi:uncharacterized membrane protein YhaH (DUF805 family)
MTRNPYKPPGSHVHDFAEASDVAAYEPENAGFFFSTRGRLGRKHYWLNGVPTVFLSIVLFGILGALLGMPWLVSVGKLLIAWSSTILVARRAHDFGYSGWWAAIYVVVLLVGAPIMARYGIGQPSAWLATLLVLLVFGVAPGDRTANRFGLPQGNNDQRPQAV